MIAEERKNELYKIMEYLAGAGDTYYFNMSQELFDKVMKNDHDKDYYKFYCHQREAGIEKVQEEAIEMIKDLDSEELHFMVDNYNYDGGAWALLQIIEHPQCDIATAKQIYWAMEPDYILERYASMSEAAQSDDYLINENAALLAKIEEKAQNNQFLRLLPPPDLTDFIGVELDYTTVSLSRVPKVMRV